MVTADIAQVKKDTISAQIHSCKMQLLSDHPLKVLQFKGFKQSPFMILSVDKLVKCDAGISRNMINKYFELFYNFNSLKQQKKHHCNLCGKKIKSIDEDVIMDCKQLFSLWLRYWSQSRNALRNILESPGGVYSVKFAVTVIQTLDNRLKNQPSLQIGCRANCRKLNKNIASLSPRALTSEIMTELLQEKCKFTAAASIIIHEG